MTAQLRGLFPSLHDYQVTSPQEERYNCIAWAAGLDTGWWWPHPDAYWPPDIPLRDNVSTFVAAFATLEYEPCSDGDVEEGFEKVAIYELSAHVKHMARQLPTGRWTSKIGELEDIEHASPADLEGAEYGSVVQYMRRPIGSR